MSFRTILPIFALFCFNASAEKLAASRCNLFQAQLSFADQLNLFGVDLRTIIEMDRNLTIGHEQEFSNNRYHVIDNWGGETDGIYSVLANNESSITIPNAPLVRIHLDNAIRTISEIDARDRRSWSYIDQYPSQDRVTDQSGGTPGLDCYFERSSSDDSLSESLQFASNRKTISVRASQVDSTIITAFDSRASERGGVLSGYQMLVRHLYGSVRKLSIHFEVFDGNSIDSARLPVNMICEYYQSNDLPESRLRVRESNLNNILATLKAARDSNNTVYQENLFTLQFPEVIMRNIQVQCEPNEPDGI